MRPSNDAGWRVLGVVLTDACNLRCGYCRVSQGSRKQVAWRALRASLDALLQSAGGKIEVTFTGGEPLLAFATLRRTVSFVEQRIGAGRVRWRLLTNGLLLDDASLSFLGAHRFIINLSFDGVPAAQALRGPATYARLDRLLTHLHDAYGELFRERLKVCLTLSPTTIPYLSDSVRYFIQRHVKAFSISPVTGAVKWEPSGMDALERQFDAVSATLRRHYECTGEVPLALFRKPAFEVAPVPSEWICLVAEGKSPTLDSDGNTYACLLATSAYQPAPAPVLRPAVEALRLGPAYAPDFLDRVAAMGDAAMASGAFQHPERRYSSYRKCADCEFLGRCRICPLASASVPGWDDRYRVSDFLCAFNQVAFTHRDRFPCQPTAHDFLSGMVPLSAFPRKRSAEPTGRRDMDTI